MNPIDKPQSMVNWQASRVRENIAGWWRMSEQMASIARYSGRSRRSKNRGDGRKDLLFSNAKPTDIEGDAMGGEMFLAWLFNVCPDLSCIYERDAVDATIGVTGLLATDVKTNRRQDDHPTLTANLWDEGHRAIIYACVQGRLPCFRFVGWTWAQYLFGKNENELPRNIANIPAAATRDGKGRQVYQLAYDQVLSPESLWDLQMAVEVEQTATEFTARLPSGKTVVIPATQHGVAWR